MAIKTILVIEDEQIDRYIEEQIIRRLSETADIISMPSATTALNYLREHTAHSGRWPELIFVDLYMPVMSGFRFLEEFSKLPGNITSNSSVFIITASVKPEDRLLVEKYTFVKDFLLKPFTEKTLTDIMKSYRIGDRETQATA